MPIWSYEIKELEKLYESIKGQLPDIEKELTQLTRSDDPNVILLYSRRCLEVIITDLCEVELKRQRGTEPLKGIIDKLHRERKVPDHIATSMHGLNDLSTYGTHPKDFDPEQVKPVLINLDIIIKWYLKYKIPDYEAREKQTHLREAPSEDTVKAPGIELHKKPVLISGQKLLTGILIAAILIIAVIFVYPKIFKRNIFEKLKSPGNRMTVAVMPFQNMTNDTAWNVWQDGIQVNLITSLSTNPEELQVRQTESINNLIKSKGIINYSSLTPSVARMISQKLNADVFINGSINRSGSTMRLNARLVDPKNQNVLKSYQIDGTPDDIIPLIDSLSAQIKNYLIITEMGKKLPEYSRKNLSTSSPEALRCYIYGRNFYNKLDFRTAQNWLTQAISADSDFIQAITMLSAAYYNEFLFQLSTKSYVDEEIYKKAKRWCLKAFEKRDKLPIELKIKTDQVYAMLFETPNEQIKYLRQLLDFDDQNPIVHYNLGSNYHELYQYDKAIEEYKTVLRIYKKWGVKPDWINDYTNLGEVYHKIGKYKEEGKLYKKAQHDFPDEPQLMYDQMVLLLTLNDTVAAQKCREKGISWMRSISMSEGSIAATTASVYENAGMLNKAEEYYRQSLSLEPENPDRLNDLASFLITRDRNVNEGIRLIEKALELKPASYLYLHTKGWGLYKQGKYKEASEVLQKSWELRREKAVYDHESFLHLEAAKKAAAGT